MDEKKFDALSAEVKTLSEGMAKIGEQIANAVATAVKPITDNIAAIKANQDAKDAAELETLRGEIVKANLLDAESAKELTLNTARVLAKKAKPGKAVGINGAFVNSSDKDEFADVDLNAAMEGK